VILPDHPAAAGQLVAKLAAEGANLLWHGSGRPWIVGWWDDDELVTASAGDRRVAVLGRTTASGQMLERRLRDIRTNAELSRLAGELSGCFHLISSLAGQVRAQGSLAGVYRVFHADLNGVTVAADRPDWLVRWCGASLDENLLSLWLLQPYGPPWPLSDRCLWRGVHAVPPGHYLELDREGSGRSVRWWSPPEPELSRAEGAERVRTVLEESIRARADATRSTALSFDLSGGMDSTTLCYVADHLGLSFTTIHYAFSDPSNPDSSWAERAQQDLSSARHMIFPTRSLPGYFVDQVQSPPDVDLEGPTNLIPRSVVEHLARLSAGAGARRHLRGHGSDELFAPGTAALATLLRRHPRRLLQSLQSRRARGRLSFATAYRQYRNPGSYRKWLHRVARNLTPGAALRQDSGWEISPRLPEWATPDAVARAQRLLVEAARERPEPVAPSPAQHMLLRGAQLGAHLTRQSSVIGERVGVSFEAPFLDDRMLEAALSIRLEQRFQARVNKPVLATAVRGVVPADILDRKDKSNGNREMFDGVRRSRTRLEEVLAEPRLAQLGLVDAGTIRSVALGLQTDVDRLSQLDGTWACEIWLRELTGLARPPAPPVSAATGAGRSVTGS
jgi:asparagine synthase (glutamine-hydrolysing)